MVLDEKRGKGSHATVFLGERYTVLKDRKKELGKGLLRAMLKDQVSKVRPAVEELNLIVQ